MHACKKSVKSFYRDELRDAIKEHFWRKKVLKVHFMNHILAIRKEDGDFLNTGDVLDIANGWHRCGIEAGRDVVPKFVYTLQRRVRQ